MHMVRLRVSVSYGVNRNVPRCGTSMLAKNRYMAWPCWIWWISALCLTPLRHLPLTFRWHVYCCNLTVMLLSLAST